MWDNPPPHLVPESTAPLTRLEIEEALTHLRATMRRAPRVMAERYHRQLDDLLEQWITAALEESLDN